MTETVTGVFETPSTAKAAVDNLKMARIPTAVVEFGGVGSTIREDSDAIWHSNASRWQMPLVMVAVHETHADAVTSIMRQYGPVRIEERRCRGTAVSFQKLGTLSGAANECSVADARNAAMRRKRWHKRSRRHGGLRRYPGGRAAASRSTSTTAL